MPCAKCSRTPEAFAAAQRSPIRPASSPAWNTAGGAEAGRGVSCLTVFKVGRGPQDGGQGRGGLGQPPESGGGGRVSPKSRPPGHHARPRGTTPAPGAPRPPAPARSCTGDDSASGGTGDGGTGGGERSGGEGGGRTSRLPAPPYRRREGTRAGGGRRRGARARRGERGGDEEGGRVRPRREVPPPFSLSPRPREIRSPCARPESGRPGGGGGPSFPSGASAGSGAAGGVAGRRRALDGAQVVAFTSPATTPIFCVCELRGGGGLRPDAAWRGSLGQVSGTAGRRRHPRPGTARDRPPTAGGYP